MQRWVLCSWLKGGLCGELPGGRGGRRFCKGTRSEGPLMAADKCDLFRSLGQGMKPQDLCVWRLSVGWMEADVAESLCRLGASPHDLLPLPGFPVGGSSAHFVNEESEAKSARDPLKVAKLVNGRMGIRPRSFRLDPVLWLDHQRDGFMHPVRNVLLLDTLNLQVTECHN